MGASFSFVRVSCCGWFPKIVCTYTGPHGLDREMSTMAEYIIVSIVLVQLCAIQLVTGTSCNWTYIGRDNLQCFPCLPGFKKVKDCLFNYTRAFCSPCQDGSYMSDCNTADKCSLCTHHHYEQWMDILINCTATTNAERQCMKGMYMTHAGYCQPHSTCTRGTGVKVAGNAVSDTVCEDCVSGETYALTISADEKCKPCTKCETYIQHCIPLRNAKCRSTDNAPGSLDIVGVTVGSLAVVMVVAVMVVVKCVYKASRLKVQIYKETSVRLLPRTRTFHSPNIEGTGQDAESRICLQEASDEETKGLIQAKQTPPVQGGRYVPLPSSKPVHVVRPLISSIKENTETSDEASGRSDQGALPEYQNTTNFTLVVECHASKKNENFDVKRQYENFDVKRQYESILQSPDKTSNEGAEKGATNTDIDANVDINWFKIFKDLVPMLPVDEWSWHSFAFELFGICQSRRGLPKDIHNEVKNIENITSKIIYLAYHEVLETWRKVMADEATLDHIEQSLQTFRNNIIMKHFLQIKSNPPKMTRCPQKTDLSDSEVPYYMYRQPEPVVPQHHCLLAYAQHESTRIYDKQNTIAHRRERQLLQLTNFSVETGSQPSQTVLQEPSERVLLKRRARKQVQGHHRMLTYGPTKVKKKVCREKWKLKEKFEATERLKKVEKQHIKTIKKLLPFDQIPLSRHEYNTFLDYTVTAIMEHNNVTRRVVLSITYKAYEEITETKNGGRYLLYCGSPKLNLDKKQYDHLKFYVKHARARVLRELTELDEHGDDIYLFLTYDGKSAIEGYHRKESGLRRQTYTELSGMDSTSSSSSDSSSQSDLGESSGTSMEDRSTSPRETVTSKTNLVSNSDKLTCSSKTNVALLQEEINGKSEDRLHTETKINSLCENKPRNESETCKEKEVNVVPNDDSEQMFVELLSKNKQFGARNETAPVSINSSMKDRMQDEKGIPYMDMSIDDLMENIDKELECSTYV